MKTLPYLTPLLTVGLALALHAAETDAPATFRYTGTVVDTAGQPVSEATLECYQHTAIVPYQSAEPELKHRVTTGTNGAFELAQLRQAITVLLARKPGYAVAWRQWSPSRSPDERVILTPPATLGGIVLDEANQPVADAEVFVRYACITTTLDARGRSYSYLSGKLARNAFSARTTADGRFRIEGFPTNAAAELVAQTPGKVMRAAPLDRISMEAMPHRPGLEDIKLVLETSSQIEGKVVVKDTGQPVADVLLWLEPASGVASRGTDPTKSGADGTFQFTSLAAGSYRVRAGFGTNALPDWVAEAVTVELAAGQTVRDVQVAATRGAILQATVVERGKRQPVAKASVHVNSVGFRTGEITDTNGRAMLRLPPGEYQVRANKEGWRPMEEPELVNIEPGETNRVELELGPPAKITGIIRAPDNQPVADLLLKLLPEYWANVGQVKTDAQGRFEFAWNPRRSGRSDETICLIARDVARKLAVAVDLDEDTTTLDLRLQPGLTLAGQVEDTAGKPITKASVTIYFWAGNSGSSFDSEPLTTDGQGRFEVHALPADRRYSVSVSAPGYGSRSEQLESNDSETNRIELPPFALAIADRPLAGKVVDEDEKPVARAYVHIYGDGQPNASAHTDEKGRFQFEGVCEGMVRLSASHQSTYGTTTAEAGDTNVVLALGSRSGYVSEQPKRPSLTGKPLPHLSAVGLGSDTSPSDRPLLLCVFDFEQRPSRRVLRLLADQHAALRQQGLAVAAIQATPADAEALKAWKEATPLPFPVGQVVEQSDVNRWATSLESLPWLLLRDAKGRVASEGFTLDDLPAQIKALSK